MIYSYAEEVQRIAERTSDNKQTINQMNKQRRNSVVDMYGIPHTAFGDANHPATVYLSVSPDLIHYLRFQLRVIIEPFRTTVQGQTGSAEVDVEPTSLKVSGTTEGSISSTTDHQGLVELEVETSSSGSGVSPNPHDHDTEPHTHAVLAGVGETHTTATDFRLLIEGIDLTPYLMEQHGGQWISGEGIFPTSSITGQNDFYDILDVAGLLYEAGEIEQHNSLLKPGFKKLQITSSSPFQATVYAYKKYSYTAR